MSLHVLLLTFTLTSLLNAEILLDDSFSWGAGTQRTSIRAGDPVQGSAVLPSKKNKWQSRRMVFGGSAGDRNGVAQHRTNPENPAGGGDILYAFIAPSSTVTTSVRLRAMYLPQSTPGVGGVCIGWQVAEPEHGYIYNQQTDHVALMVSRDGRILLRTHLGVSPMGKIFIAEGEWIEITFTVDPAQSMVSFRMETQGGKTSEGSAPWDGDLSFTPTFAINLMGCDEAEVDRVRMEQQ